MDVSKRIRPLSLVDQAFERISDAIVKGEIGAGERIREAFLAKQLGISRGVLREAMRRLEGRKLVMRQSNVGVHVTRLSPRDLDELYDIREALESAAAKLAALNMSDAEIAALSDAVKRHGQTAEIKSGGAYYQKQADDDFHFLIARGSRNDRLVQCLCEDLYFELKPYRYRSSARPGRAQAALAEHEAIVEAIAARDPERAAQAMRRHLSAARASRQTPAGPAG